MINLVNIFSIVKDTNQKHLKVCVVIVTWNNENDIEECLKSLLKNEYKGEWKVIVVDNASNDKTPNILREHNTNPKVDLIFSEKNKFFTGGNNVGFKYSLKNYNPKYIITLNPDTLVETNLIESLVSVAEQDDTIGMVGPKIKFVQNQNEGLINSAGLIFDGFMQGYDRGFMEEDTGQYDITEEVVAVSGTCTLFRSKMITEIGMYWETLRMYLEDLEIALRAKKKGWRSVYTAKTTVGHKYMQSTNQSKLVRKRGWMHRNWLLIALRHYPLTRKFAMIKKYILFLLTSYK